MCGILFFLDTHLGLGWILQPESVFQTKKFILRCWEHNSGD